MTRDRLNEHKENMDKIMDRLGGRRDDIWQDRFIYDIAAAIHDLLVEKERKEMDKWIAVDAIANLLFIFCLILESCYIKKLEHDIDALKSWIEAFWKIDFGAMADAVAEADDFCSYGEREGE